MKRLCMICALTLLWGVCAAQNQNNPLQSWIQLLQPPLKANGNQTSGPLLLWPGSIGVFDCVGTWGGATVTLEYTGADGVTMLVAGTNTTLTANGGAVFYLPAVNIQAVVSGAGASTSLTCAAGAVPSPPTS